MPIRPRNIDNTRSVELGAAHKDHEHSHADLNGVTPDQHHAEAHTIASHSDTTATGAELETLTNGSNADALHSHSGIGEHTHTESDVTDLDHYDSTDFAADHAGADHAHDHDADYAGIVHAHTESDITDLDHYDSSDFTADHNAVSGGHVTNGNSHDHVGGDGAQIDHGGLAGLADDDHTQYLNVTRHDGDDHSALPEAAVTQHEAALSITESQITDLNHFDNAAIHDNVSGEIAAITEKSSPTSNDLILIEDSAASNAKKRVQIGNLPGGGSGGVTDHGDLTGLGDDDHTQYLNDTRHAAIHGALRAQRGGTNQDNIASGATLIYNTIINEDDPNNDFTLNTSTGVITINNAGWYSIMAGAFMSNSDASLFNMQLLANTLGLLAAKRFSAASGARVDTFSTIAKLPAGDTVWVTMNHDASSVNFLATAGSFFAIARIR